MLDVESYLSIDKLHEIMKNIFDKFLEVTKNNGKEINDSNYWKKNDLMYELI